jgi:hypothetical protein
LKIHSRMRPDGIARRAWRCLPFNNAGLLEPTVAGAVLWRLDWKKVQITAKRAGTITTDK